MAFGARFVGIEVGVNAIRAVAIRKTGSGYRVVAAEKLDLDVSRGKIIEFPEDNTPAVFAQEVSELIRRVGKGAKRTSISVSEIEILLRHLPIPRSAGENLHPLIRAVLASPTSEPVTFTYRRLPKAAPAPDHDLVLVAASRGELMRKLVAGLKEEGLKVEGLTPHSEALLHLARTAAADIPPGTPIVSLGADADEGEEDLGLSEEDQPAGGETSSETFVLLDEGGPLFAIAPDTDLKSVSFAIIEDGDLLFARRVPLTSVATETGRPADGMGVIGEIATEAQRTIDLAKGTLKRADMVPGDIRIFGRHRVCQELAEALTRKMSLPVRTVPAEGWGSVTVQPGIVFDPGDFALALGLAIATAEDDVMVVPPAEVRLEKLGVHGRMRMYAAIAGVAIAIIVPYARKYYHVELQETYAAKAQQNLSRIVQDEAGLLGRAEGYANYSSNYLKHLRGSIDDGGVGLLSFLFDILPQEVKVNSIEISAIQVRGEERVFPTEKKRVTINGLIDTRTGNSLQGVVANLAQALETEGFVAVAPAALGRVDFFGTEVERFSLSFDTPEFKEAP